MLLLLLLPMTTMFAKLYFVAKHTTNSLLCIMHAETASA